MNAELTRTYCRPTPGAMVLLEQAFEKLGLSARAYDKVLRVARTTRTLTAATLLKSRTSPRPSSSAVWTASSGKTDRPGGVSALWSLP
jgi:predicted ATPase with chaperone activity